MNTNRKEEIILATLKLASEKGLRAVSMSMIADSLSIKKPSLYNHFKSKEEIISEMYLFLRERAKKDINTSLDFSTLNNKTAFEILSFCVNNYIALCNDVNMQMFYKVIYSERAFSSEAAKILSTETEKMINATTKLFEFLENKNLLCFKNLNISATSFALCIHSLMDYSLDKSLGNNENPTIDKDMINEYIKNFCSEHSFKE